MRANDVERPVSPRLILAILIATIIGLVGATLLTQSIASSVNDDAISIATNSVPAIQELSDSRGELVRIALAMASPLSNRPEVDEADLATIAAALSAIRGDLQRYLRQPFYPREASEYAEVDHSLRVLEAGATDLRATVAAGNRDAAVDIVNTVLLPAVGRVDHAISALVHFNTEQQRRLGFDIPARRRRAHRIGYGLQALTAIFGLILMSLVIRGMRDYARLLARARAASRARDDLLATVSHDLRNPINAIALTVRSIRRASSDARMEKQTARIQHATERMDRLIDDLLDAAKIEEGALRPEPSPEDVSRLVESVVEMFRPMADEKSVRIAWRPPTAPAVVSCERHMILRVLSNIIGNAMKFSPRGGAVTVTAERLSTHEQFSISDEGPGIPVEHRPHIFDRYWHQKKANRKGTGLGLYIARGIVEAHGGRIWIEDRSPGTTVSFTLPLERPREAASE